MSPGNNQFLFAHLEARNPDLSCLRDPKLGLARLNDLAKAHRCPVRFCGKAVPDALAYEQRIVHEGQVPTRIHTWHDRFNAAMWILWPQSKLSISQAHLQAATKPSPPGSRHPKRDALTLLDEAGMILVASPDIAALHREHRWEALFWGARTQWFDSIHPFFLGHGLAEQCLSPYLGLTGKALYLGPEAASQPDAVLAQLLGDPNRLASPRDLLPFPLLGTPGWHPDNDRRAFFDNPRYFRPLSRRLSSRG